MPCFIHQIISVIKLSVLKWTTPHVYMYISQAHSILSNTYNCGRGRCGLKRKNLLTKYTRYNQIFMRPLIYIFKHFLFLFTDKPYKSYFTIWQSIYPNIFRAIYNEGPQKIPPRVATYPSTYHTILLVKYPETNIYNGPFYYRYIFIFIYYDILYILRVL